MFINHVDPDRGDPNIHTNRRSSFLGMERLIAIGIDPRPSWTKPDETV
jgi:hypothetical protein